MDLSNPVKSQQYNYNTCYPGITQIIYTKVTLVTRSSFSFKVITRTPWVARPRMEMDFKGMRMVWPLPDMAITSFLVSASMVLRATMAPASWPVLDVAFTVFMPEPPRDWTLYSLMFERLP